MEKANADPAFQTVDLNLKFNKPEMTIEIDRDKAHALGISVRNIAEALQTLFSGQRYGFFIKDSKQYYVIGQLNRGERDKPAHLTSMYVRNNRGELVQLDNVVNVTFQQQPAAALPVQPVCFCHRICSSCKRSDARTGDRRNAEDRRHNPGRHFYHQSGGNIKGIR